MMSLRQFDALAQSYGADLCRWPESDRAAAAVLLSAETAAGRDARAICDRQYRLDAAIQVAFEADIAESWHEGEEAAALERLRLDVDHRIGNQRRAANLLARLQHMLQPVSGPARMRLDGLPGLGVVGLRSVGLVAGSGVVVLTGLWFGMMHHPGMPADLFGTLQSLPFGDPGS